MISVIGQGVLVFQCHMILAHHVVYSDADTRPTWVRSSAWLEQCTFNKNGVFGTFKDVESNALAASSNLVGPVKPFTKGLSKQ